MTADPGVGTAREPLPGAPAAVAPPPTDPLAISALVASFFLPLAGIVLGHLALGRVRRSGGSGRGLAVAALAVGYGTIGLAVLVLLVLAVAVLAMSVTVAGAAATLPLVP